MNKNKITFFIVVFTLAVVGGVQWFMNSSRGKADKTSTGRSIGNPQSAIQVIEFVDFQCPACAVGSAYLKQFIKDNPDKIHLALKYYPLPMHRHGAAAARWAECASRQGKFWPFQALLFERQKEWDYLIDATPAFQLMAKEIKMDVPALESCVKDEKIDAVIMKEKSEGKLLGVSSTPTYFINGKMAVGHKNLQSELEPLIHAQTK